MEQQYLVIKARSTVTGETVKNQDLTGGRFLPNQRVLAEDMARQLAVKMSKRTGDTWTGFVELYTPNGR